MGSRLNLQTLLQTVIGERPDGKQNVYFQPPSNITMNYPAIVYERNSSKTLFADDKVYRRTKSYQVMVIDQNPDSELPDKIEDLPMCSVERHFTADTLNHFVYNLYY